MGHCITNCDTVCGEVCFTSVLFLWDTHKLSLITRGHPDKSHGETKRLTSNSQDGLGPQNKERLGNCHTLRGHDDAMSHAVLAGLLEQKQGLRHEQRESEKRKDFTE